jgi:hypothetical protein
MAEVRSAMTALRRHQTVAGKPRRTCNAVCASSPERAVASFPQIEGLVAGLADGVTPRPGPWPQAHRSIRRIFRTLVADDATDFLFDRRQHYHVPIVTQN